MSYRLVTFLLIFMACGSHPPPSKPVVPSESLVECLNRTGVRLYGAPWCHWCHVQLKEFGADASKVPYTDCDPDANLKLAPACAKAGLTLDGRFPMWIFPGLGRVSGVREPKVIARIAGCPLPGKHQ